jgi:hypothetical protein
MSVLVYQESRIKAEKSQRKQGELAAQVVVNSAVPVFMFSSPTDTLTEINLPMTVPLWSEIPQRSVTAQTSG